jgi:hypothetical protein
MADGCSTYIRSVFDVRRSMFGVSSSDHTLRYGAGSIRTPGDIVALIVIASR